VCNPFNRHNNKKPSRFIKGQVSLEKYKEENTNLHNEIEKQRQVRKFSNLKVHNRNFLVKNYLFI